MNLEDKCNDKTCEKWSKKSFKEDYKIEGDKEGYVDNIYEKLQKMYGVKKDNMCVNIKSYYTCKYFFESGCYERNLEMKKRKEEQKNYSKNILYSDENASRTR